MYVCMYVYMCVCVCVCACVCEYIYIYIYKYNTHIYILFLFFGYIVFYLHVFYCYMNCCSRENSFILVKFNHLSLF